MIQNNQLYQNDIEEALQLLGELSWLDGKKIFITGSTGMVGSCLTDMLMVCAIKHNCSVKVVAMARDEDKLSERFAPYLMLNNFSYVIGDISVAVPELEVIPDIIVHAASNSHPLAYAEDPVGTIKTNVFGLDNLLQYAVRNKVNQVLFLSSVEVYGENRTGKERFTESDCGCIDCNTTRAGYPESKRLGEALCQAYRAKYGIDVVIARLSRLYGPTMREDDSKVISQFIQRAIDKQDIILKSNGQAIYSYTYIVDAVSALIILLIKGLPGEAYNIADNQSETTIMHLAETMAQIAGTRVVHGLPDKMEEAGYSNIKKSLLCAEKIENLGWKALTPLKQGLTKTVKMLR